MDFTSINEISKSYLGSFYSQNIMAGKTNPVSFQAVLDVNMGEQGLEDIFSTTFPTNDVSVKVGNCDIASEIWKRQDFPVWRYFQDDVSADNLNNWKPTGAEPTEAEPYIQQELSKIDFGKIVVMLPENLQKKMEADPEYAQEIAEKLQKWKTDYDREDNAIAVSQGDDPILYQMTKRYCIQLDEDGNVKDYAVISGGIDTKKSDDTNRTDNEAPRKTVAKTVKPKPIQGEVANAITGFVEVDYTNIAPYLVTFNKNKERQN